MRAVRAALLALAVSACAKDLASLTPFPCAKDNTCPDGVACLPGVGCVAPRPDVLCADDGGCAAVGAGAICNQGRCFLGCANGTGCATGRVCSSSKAAGICAAECTSDASCEGQLTCQPLFGSTSKACLPPNSAPGDVCPTVGVSCGPLGSGGICDLGRCRQACANGAGCGTGQLCTASAGSGVCIAACGASDACASGTACANLWDGRRACLPPATGFETACTGSATCGPLGSNSRCEAGRCMATCTNGAGCPSGRTCSTATGAGICLQECPGGTGCATGFACNGPWPSDKRYCAPEGTGVGALCNTAATCSFGGLSASCENGRCFASCANGAGCPTDFVCTAAAGKGNGVCVRDCSSNASICASETVNAAVLSCKTLLGSGGKQACLPQGAALDDACTAEGAACGIVGSGGTCALGACSEPCIAGPSCGAGRICSASTGSGGCVTDCTTGGTCSGGLSCTELYGTPKLACGRRATSACASVGAGAACTNCGAAEFNVACSGSGTCTKLAACLPGNPPQCQCQGALAVTCAGAPCTGGCTYPNWWCRPPEATTLGCADYPVNASGTCNCKDGRTIAQSCVRAGNPVQTCEQACSEQCQPTDSPQCPNAGARSKCSFIAVGASSLTMGCVVPGAKAEGDPCTPGPIPGHDDCGTGLYCTHQGSTSRLDSYCRKLCNSNSCTAGQQCTHLMDRPWSWGQWGVCLPTTGATVFDGPGVNCPQGMAAQAMLSFDGSAFVTRCRKASGAAAGSACSELVDCAAGLFCAATFGSAPNRVCTPYCDATHPCPSGGLCVTKPVPAGVALPNGVGFCF